MSLATGARLGPYELLEPIGKGGMGEVYRARDTRLRRDVAIKVLPEQTSSSAEALARFEYEARAVAGLNHPNILALHDVGVQTGVSYAVTELLEGETLRERLARDGPMPPRKALDLAVQFARGLAAAHSRGIVHRDLKPENLFVTDDGRLKILDFGLATPAAASMSSTTTETRFVTEPGVLLGTVGYMSPEQVRGEPASARSDIFSFGLVLHEVLTGSNPFWRNTMAETMAAILRDQPQPLESRPGLPAVAARLVDRCLEKRAEDRPESMRDLALVLEAVAASTASATAQPVDSDQQFRRIALWSLAGVCALVTLLGLGMSAYVGMRADRVSESAMARDLARADTAVRRAQQDRLSRLQSHARLVASIPELRALFETTNAPTVRDYLRGYEQNNPGTPLLVALQPGGALFASDTGVEAAPERGAWLAALLPNGGTGVITINGRPYHAAVANAEAGGTIFASILAAAPIDDEFAQVLREMTLGEAVLLDNRGILGASLRSGQVPWTSLDAFRRAGGKADAALDTRIGGARYTAREVTLVKEPPIAAVILASRDDVTAPYRGIQTALVIIGLAAAALVLAAGLLALRRWGNPG